MLTVDSEITVKVKPNMNTVTNVFVTSKYDRVKIVNVTSNNVELETNKFTLQPLETKFIKITVNNNKESNVIFTTDNQDFITNIKFELI
jgi:hypothetical protein